MFLFRVGAGIYKHDQQPIPYNNETPFFAFQVCCLCKKKIQLVGAVVWWVLFCLKYRIPIFILASSSYAYQLSFNF